MTAKSSPVPLSMCLREHDQGLPLKRLATDISLVIDEERAKCDTWCELQNPVNHRVFERKLRPKPSRRGHACLVSQIAAPNPLEDIGRKLVSVCYRTPLAKIRAKDARSALTCGGEFNSRQIAIASSESS
ncbi:hypothetical protein Bca101_101483 [Brassica carinata]